MTSAVISLDDRERVQISLGPIPSQVVLSWCTYARLALNTMAVEDHPFELPLDIELQLRDCLQSMMEVAAPGPVFQWDTSIDVERLKLILQYWFNIAALLDEQARRRGFVAAAADTREFYEHLVERLTAALPAGTFAQRLRTTWPGLALV